MHILLINFGKEIIEAFNNKDEHNLGIFCDFVGTGGSFSGCARVLKQWNHDIKCYVVEPKNYPHVIQGGGYGYTIESLHNLNKALIDGHILISNEEAKQGMSDLAKLEGIFGSFSSGTNLMATIKAMSFPENKNIDAIFSVCDTGLKYLSVL
jgi:cysteine synthase A